MSGPDATTEQELRRRLAALAETAEVPPDAWTRLARRTVDAPPTRRHVPRPGPRSRVLLVAAAVVAVVIATVVASDGSDDEDDLRIGDDSTTTTTDEPRPRPDPEGTDRSTPSSSSSSSSTTSPARAQPPAPPTETAPAAGDREAGDRAAGDRAAAPGAGGREAAPGAGDGGDGGPAAGATPTAAPPRPPRATATMTLASSEYSVEIIAEPGPDPAIWFRRTDLVGVELGGPDGYGTDMWSAWTGLAGARCLLTSGGEMSYPDAGRHAFDFGFAGSEIARVDLVMAGGTRVTARMGPTVGGLRTWLTERPLGALDRIEGIGAGGTVLATATGFATGTDDFAYTPDTC